MPKKRAKRPFFGTELATIGAVVLAIKERVLECATLGVRLGDEKIV
jgi:hypothetical protein